MAEEEIDYSTVDWEEQESEMEALDCIFPEELVVRAIKPYTFEIMINSNPEKEENHLKMLLKVELPHDYPNSVPFLNLKNMSPQYLDNAMLDDYETQARVMTREMLGSQMIFDICESMREKIAAINDEVLNKYYKIKEDIKKQEEIDAGPQVFQSDNLNYTPVNEETFSVWCTEFLADLETQRVQKMTDFDKRPSGR
tara:strand:- start:257 stop:847 length:591 start_codon:yes stop_codon:yes gene_type:complete